MTPLTVGRLPAPEMHAPDRRSGPIRSVRGASALVLAENIAGTVIITIGVGWVGGYAIALALLNRSVLSALGIAP